ncbi:MAG: hypothetical protein ACRCRZ_00950 [Metamycoplasmataceae bacterium]
MLWIYILLPILIILFCFLTINIYTSFEIKKQKKFLEDEKKKNDTSTLIKYKNEIGSIGSIEMENQKTIQIEELWHSIDNLKNRNRKLINDGLKLIEEKKIFQSKKIVQKIMKNDGIINKEDTSFFELSNSILGNSKILKNKLIKFRNGIREIKMFFEQNKNKLEIRTNEYIQQELIKSEVLIKNIDKYNKNIDINNAKNDFVKLSFIFKSLIIFVDSCEQIDKHLYDIYKDLKKNIISYFNKLRIFLNNDLSYLNFDIMLDNIESKKEAAILLYYEGKIDACKDLIHEWMKMFSNLNDNLDKEKNAAIFIRKRKVLFEKLIKSMNNKFMDISNQIDKAKLIDEQYFYEWEELKQKQKKQLIDIEILWNDLYEENFDDSFSKKFFQYKQLLNHIKILDNEIEEQYSHLKYFYYEGSSLKLKFEMLNKMLVNINFLIRKEFILISNKTINNYKMINEISQSIQKKIIKDPNANFDEEYKEIYKLSSNYLIDCSIALYQVILFKKMQSWYSLKRSNNSFLNDQVKEAEKNFMLGEYKKALNIIIKAGKQEVN